jgi:hypothetical protein
LNSLKNLNSWKFEQIDYLEKPEKLEDPEQLKYLEQPRKAGVA